MNNWKTGGQRTTGRAENIFDTNIKTGYTLLKNFSSDQFVKFAHKKFWLWPRLELSLIITWHWPRSAGSGLFCKPSRPGCVTACNFPSRISDIFSQCCAMIWWWLISWGWWLAGCQGRGIYWVGRGPPVKIRHAPASRLPARPCYGGKFGGDVRMLDCITLQTYRPPVSTVVHMSTCPTI